MKTLRYLSLLCSLALIVACTPNTSTESQKSDEEVDVNGFADFYAKFHRDSAFQMDHILFPLEGIPRMVDSSFIASGKKFYWQKEDWDIHKEINLEESGFEREMQVTDYLIEEKLKNKEFFIMRRFYFTGGQWFLIYYSDLNAAGKPLPGSEEAKEAGGNDI